MVISHGEASEVLHPVEASLDAAAIFVGGFVVGDDDLVRAVRWDDGFRSHAGNSFSQGIAVIGFISQHGIAARSLHKSRRLRDITRLTGRDDETQRRPGASTSMCTLVVSPPRERPSA